MNVFRVPGTVKVAAIVLVIFAKRGGGLMAPFAAVQWSWVDYCLAVRLGTPDPARLP
jgi:hypothetical protein